MLNHPKKQPENISVRSGFPLIKGPYMSRVFGYCMSLQNTSIQALGMDVGSMALVKP